MNAPKTYLLWCEMSLYFTDIGRELAAIEQSLHRLHATTNHPSWCIDDALKHARKLVKHIEMVKFAEAAHRDET